MCDQYPVHTALIHEPESVHRLTEGACPNCVMPLQQHEHPFMKRQTNWTPSEWRFGLCPKCLKCWRVELQGENPPSGMVYEVTPKCHEYEVDYEKRGGVYA